MNLSALWKPLVLYTGALGLLTVGAIYLITHSGFIMLMMAGSGLLLVVLGGGTAGPLSASGAEHTEDTGAGLMVEDMGLRLHAYTDTALRHIFLLYGFGVFLWSLIALVTLRDTLV